MRYLYILFFFFPSFIFSEEIVPAQALLDWRSYFVLFLLLVMVILLVKEIFPPDLTLLVGGTIPVILGIVPAKRLLYSFANETIITIAALFIVVRAFERTGLIVFLVRKLLPKTGSRIKQLVSLLIPLGFFSAFLNNTPLVMVLTPVVRRWALSRKLCPSKFLIPLSYAAILGGTCTLIGTSTNLVINGLLLEKYPASAFQFFELGKIGLPCALVGFIYLIFFSHRLLPSCTDPEIALSKNMRNMTAKFLLKEGFPYRTVEEFGKKQLLGEFSIVEIERAGKKISAPKPEESLLKDDHILLAGDVRGIARLQKIEGLEFHPDPDFTWYERSSHFSEFVVPSDSLLVGKTLKSIRFRTRLGGVVFAMYRQGKQIKEKLGDVSIKAGDVLMVFSSKPYDSEERSSDLYLMKPSEEISTLKPKKAWFVGCIVFLMILAATLHVPMMIAALSAAVIFILTKIVSGSGVVKGINWNLLILIAGGLAFSSALEVTHVARFLGQKLFQFVGSEPYMMVAGLFLITTLFTELITNTAAVLIIFPIALEALHLAGIYSPSALTGLGVTMAIAGSCSFLTPVGYQTNTIVFGPGGYRFFDYLKIGIPLNLLIWLLCIWLIPQIWQF